jgi:hypothetical protein
VSFRLHIERLVLEGLPIRAEDGGRLSRAVEEELARLISERRPAPVSDGAVPHLRGGSVPWESPLRPAYAGAEIARAIWSSLTPSSTTGGRAGPAPARGE